MATKRTEPVVDEDEEQATREGWRIYGCEEHRRWVMVFKGDAPPTENECGHPLSWRPVLKPQPRG